ncbi:hypothetical protein WR25_09069 isoform B [Diploscapter pachys]|uniref:Uncharacterized protein n=3 Tax=Diploscapter pachys TaxID=2018661 RepID=A0A2A2JMS0_9BILA|nr:hypothetical protein WR25_09069 isoform B [Diploscapter pachys]
MLSTLCKSSIRPSIYRTRWEGLSSAAASAAKATQNNAQETSKKPQETKSFAMNLFRGKAVLDQVFPYPLNLDSDRKETLQMIIGPTEKFLQEVNNTDKSDNSSLSSERMNCRNDERAEIPREVLSKFGELGAFGALVPPEYEGAGLNNSQMAKLAEIVGAYDLGLGVVMGAHQSIGYKGILLYGSEEQKKKYLPDLASGRKFAAFCLTEPSSGSDANSIRSTAVKSADGSHYVLNGGKIFISNGGFADVFTVFAQTPIKQADGSTKNKIPASNLIGQEGEGFKVAMNILNNGRFGIPAAMTGAMKFCIQKTIEHVTQRTQFGKKLEEFGDVQEKVAMMLARHYATESLVYMLAANMDSGVMDYQIEAAAAKVFASECAWTVCDDAIQLYGGMGFMRESQLERVLRDLRIFRIFEGANDVMRLFVSLTGMQHAGKHLAQVAKEIKSGGIATLLSELTKRVGGGNLGGSSSELVDPSLKDAAAKLDACMMEFGKTVEKLLIKHKKGIIDRQYELARVANAFINIYAMAVTLSRCTYSHKHKLSSAGHETKIANYFVEIASRDAMSALKVAQNGHDAEQALIGSVAKEVLGNGGLVQKHPIDI